MKPTAFIINTARGPVIDEKALVRALRRKRSPAPGSTCSSTSRRSRRELQRMKNVVLNPHLGSAVVEMREEMANIVVDNIEALLAGRTPPNCVNPEVLDK